MADIFLSYADHDMKAIRPLVKALEQEGWSVFWDREIPLGKTWRQVLDDELAAARCVVVVWTETSVNRRWVIEEAEEGQSRGILIPVFMDRVDPPRGFREVQGAQLSDWKNKPSHTELRRLCTACRELIGEGGQPHGEEPAEPPRASRPGFKWMAGALVVALMVGGSWLWHQTTQQKAESPDVRAKEPVQEADPLVTALQYKEACDRGSAQDCMLLGDLYSLGRGVGEDALRAAALYQQACDGNIPTACMRLGALYQEGRAVAQDQDRAAALYQQACDAGLEAGCERFERAKQGAQRSPEAQPASGAAATSEALAARRAQLRITVLPWGDVWINGKYRRRAPLDVSLKPGKYTISVGQGTPSRSREVRLRSGEETTEHFDLSQ